MFCMCVCMCMLSRFRRVWLFVTPWTIVHQAPLFLGFFRQEYCSGLLYPSPRDLPNPGIGPMSLTSPALAGGFFTTHATWETPLHVYTISIYIFFFFFFSLTMEDFFLFFSGLSNQLLETELLTMLGTWEPREGSWSKVEQKSQQLLNNSPMVECDWGGDRKKVMTFSFYCYIPKKCLHPYNPEAHSPESNIQVLNYEFLKKSLQKDLYPSLPER